MMSWYFRLTDAQFAILKPLLPRDTRGVPRVDDRRVISGIGHVLKSGGRWSDAPPVTGPRKTRPLRRQGASLPHWRKAGVDKGGSAARQSAGHAADERQRLVPAQAGIHALTDRFCRPLAFLLTDGNVADCTAGDALLERMVGSVDPAWRQRL